MSNCNNGNIIERKCPFCGENKYSLTSYGSQEWPIVSCDICGFVYIRVVPDYSRLVEEFAWEKTSKQTNISRKNKWPVFQKISNVFKEIRLSIFKKNKLLAFVDKYVNSGGHVLDVGCGWGSFLTELPSNYIPHGIEVSEELAKIAQNNVKHRNGIIIHDNAANGLKKVEKNFFDCIVMHAFLEHEMSPILVLQNAYSALKEGGILIIKVPNYASLLRKIMQSKWCGFRLPDHVNYFTPSTLLTCCTRNGYKVKQFNFIDQLPISDNMWIILEK